MQGRPFDPYYVWLGIKRGEHPPNHYRLLDIELFEADEEIIDIGYQRRMAYLRNIKNGDRLELAERLKNELAEACRCLLSPEKKAAYDKKLSARLAGAGKLPPVVAEPELPLAIDFSESKAAHPHLKSRDNAATGLESSASNSHWLEPWPTHSQVPTLRETNFELETEPDDESVAGDWAAFIGWVLILGGFALMVYIVVTYGFLGLFGLILIITLLSSMMSKPK